MPSDRTSITCPIWPAGTQSVKVNSVHDQHEIPLTSSSICTTTLLSRELQLVPGSNKVHIDPPSLSLSASFFCSEANWTLGVLLLASFVFLCHSLFSFTLYHNGKIHYRLVLLIHKQKHDLCIFMFTKWAT